MKPKSARLRSNLSFTSRSRQTLPLLVTLGLAISSSSLFADDILSWDIENNTTGSTSVNTPVGAAHISGTVITAGIGTIDPGNAETSYWNRTGFDALDYDAAQSASQYYSFSTTVESGFTATITGIGSSRIKIGTKGPTTIGLFHSTDNVTFTQVGDSANMAGVTVDVGNKFNAGVSSSPIVISGGETHYWRMVGFGATSTTNAGRVRWEALSLTSDFSLVGTVESDTPIPYLTWTGAGGNNWNTTPSNKNWDDDNGPAPFANGDNVIIDIPAAITVDAAGVSPGIVKVGNASGAVLLSGGNITGETLIKTGDGSLEIGGSNQFTAGVSIEGGVLQIDTNSALGTLPATLKGGTLAPDAALSEVSTDFLVGSAPSAIDTAGDVTFSGGFLATGAAGSVTNVLNKTGAGVLTFSSTFGAETVSGAKAETIRLNVTDGGVVFEGSDIRHLGGNMVWDAPVTLAGGVIQLHGGSVSGSGSIDLTADSTIRARLNFGATSVSNAVEIPDGINLELDSPFGGNRLDMNGEISGDGSVSKTGGTEVKLRAANSYAGGTSANSGTLTISDPGSLGSGDVTISGAQLRIEQIDGAISNNITLSGTTAGLNDNIGRGALAVHNEGQSSTFSGTVTLAGNTLFRSYSGGGEVIFEQPIAGAGPLTFEAGGASTGHTQQWSLQGGESTFSGDVTLRSDGSANAVLTLDGGSLPANSILTLEDRSIVGGNTAVLDLNGNNQTLAGLVRIDGPNGLDSFVTNSSGNQSTLTIDSADDSTFTGVIGANTAVGVTGGTAGGDNISLVKKGGGTFTLGGENTYTGNTTVLDGTLSFTTMNFSDTSTVTIDGGMLELSDANTDIVGSLVIGGVAKPGGGAIYDKNNTGGAIVGGGKLQVGFAGGGFAAWVSGPPYNLTGANALPNADPDKDGIPNAIEFVIGGNPANGSDTGKLPSGVIVGANLEFSFRLTNAAAYLNPTVEYGSDLVGWTTAMNGVDGVTIGAPTDLEAGVKEIVVTIPKNSKTKRFARLKVVIP